MITYIKHFIYYYLIKINTIHYKQYHPIQINLNYLTKITIQTKKNKQKINNPL